MIVIDGTSFNVDVLSVKRTGDFLYKYAERTEDGKLHVELIGVYFNYKLQFAETTNSTEYAALWAKLSEAVAFHTVTVPDEGGDYTFSAYFAGLGDELRKQKGAVNYWKNLAVNFIAEDPAIV